MLIFRALIDKVISNSCKPFFLEFVSERYQSNFHLTADGLVCSKFDLLVRGQCISYKGKQYQYHEDVVLVGEVPRMFEDGAAYYLSNDDEELNLKPEILWNLESIETLIAPAFVFGLSGSRRNRKIVSCDLINNSFIQRDARKFQSDTQFGDLYVCISNLDKTIVCYDTNLAEKWSLSLEGLYLRNVMTKADLHKPLEYDDGFIVHLGGSELKKHEYTHKDGQVEQVELFVSSDLRRYRLEDGNLIWQTDLKGEIQHIQIVGESIFVGTNYSLFEICANSGETIRAFDLPFSTLYEKYSHGSSFYVTEDLIFYGHSYDEKFLIYSREDFSVIHDVEMPKKWRISAMNRPYFNTVTNKLYMEVTLGGQVFVNTSIIEIDLDNIDAPVEVETGPGFEIDIVDSEANASEKEIQISCTDTDFDTVLRFAEIWVREEAFTHGLNMLSSQKFTEGFNGKIRFSYLADLGDQQADISQKLDMMEQRFNYWADTYSMYSADQSTACSLHTNK